MTTRVFADDLTGPAWDRVRAIRKRLYGRDERGVALDDQKVPETFQHLLPLASLLTTGEEGALLDFWEALDAPEQRVVLSAVEPLANKLRDFGLDGFEGLDARPPMRTEVPTSFDFSAERIAEMLDVVAAEMKRKGRPSVEQHAMLDLARLCDLVAAAGMRTNQVGDDD